MKVIDCTSKQHSLPFRELNPGECFRLPAGERVYMKLGFGAAQLPGDYGAVMLGSGDCYRVSPDKEVIPVKVEARVIES